jgi:hypothetical protein
MVQPGSSQGNHVWLQGYDTDTDFFVWHTSRAERNDLFRQPAVLQELSGEDVELHEAKLYKCGEQKANSAAPCRDRLQF